MSEPTTQAGKRLLNRVAELNARSFPLAEADDILAIEAEARADLAALVAAARGYVAHIEDLSHDDNDGCYDPNDD